MRGQGAGARGQEERRTQRPTGRRSLLVWQKAMDLVDAVYDASEGWPPQQQFRMTAQLQRAVVSVPSNIAEGHGRTGPNEYADHLSIAYGSLCETETLVTAARRRRYIDSATEDRSLEAAAEIGRLLNGLLRSLR